MKQVMAIVLLQTLSLAMGCRAEQLEQPRVAIATASDAKSGSNMISINLPPSECQNLSPMFSGKVKSFKPDWGTYCEAFNLPDCQTSGERLSDIDHPGIEDLSLKKTTKGSTWQAEMKSYRCKFDCEHKVAALERSLAAAYVALSKGKKDDQSSSEEKEGR